MPSHLGVFVWQVFSPGDDGKMNSRRVIGREGDAPGHFKDPMGVAVVRGLLVVSEAGGRAGSSRGLHGKRLQVRAALRLGSKAWLHLGFAMVVVCELAMLLGPHLAQLLLVLAGWLMYVQVRPFSCAHPLNPKP